MRLPDVFLSVPIAHRAYHDRAAGRPENSRAAIRHAIEHGYGIEIDLQLSSDGQAMVFHDAHLGRLTGEQGVIRDFTAAELGDITLRDCDEGIPTLEEVLEIVEGRVPLLIELKDQDGALGPAVGVLERSVAACLHRYAGQAAVMSFNYHTVVEMAACAPETPRGRVTEAFAENDWPDVPASRLSQFRDMADFGSAGECFISHDRRDLGRQRVAQLKASGVPVLCWTVKSAEQERVARQVADNITFEGYAAHRPS